MVDITELLSEQPLIDEDGGDEGLDTTNELEGSGGDYSGGDEPPEAEGGDEPPARNQKVPLSALQEERTRRQDLQNKLQEREQEQSRLNERLTKLLEAQQISQQQAQQKPPEEVPAFVDDPEAAFLHLQRKLAEAEQRMQQYVQGNQQQLQEQQQHVHLAQNVSAQEAVFKQATPDYEAALAHLVDLKTREYGTFMDEVAAKRQLGLDFTGIATYARNTGQNPAKLAYDLAKNLGYVPGAQQRQQGRSLQSNTPNTSLGNVTGSPKAPDEKGPLSVADVSSMSEADFDKLWNSMARGAGNVRPKV